jgi:SAM-dependent methyltransferase
MNRHTEAARAWLDRRYRRNGQGQYRSHQPIFGIQTECSEPNRLLRLARTYRLLQVLGTLEFETVLDVGAGEGYLAALIRHLFGVTVHTTDLSVEACCRAREIFDVQGVAAECGNLPLADNSYDLVICSEVIEHLSQPVTAIGELTRIARKALVITTAEFCPLGELERTLRGYTLDGTYPHAEQNWFTARDFEILLGDDVTLTSQFRSLAHLIPDLPWSRVEMEWILTTLTATSALSVDHTGVIVISPRAGCLAAGASTHAAAPDARLIDTLLNPPTRKFPSAVPEEMGAVEASLLRSLRCLACEGTLVASPDWLLLSCTGCGCTYDVRQGVPVMFLADPTEAPLDPQIVLRQAEGDPRRQQQILELIAQLHHQQMVHHHAITRWTAAQLLRILWFCRREERFTEKASRLFLKLAGRGAREAGELRWLVSGAPEGPEAPQSPGTPGAARKAS